MTTDQFQWEAQPPSAEDQRLIDAYLEIGLPLDGLAYTDQFKELAKRAGFDPTDDSSLRMAYRRLLALRKRALLPRIYASSPSAASASSSDVEE